jgi:hypothetical protein
VGALNKNKKMMKKLFTAAILLLSISNSFSQSVLVPYRVGDKFGFADLKGNMVIPAAYDYPILRRRYPKGFFCADKNGKKTVISDHKIIIQDSECSDFEIHENKFIGAKKEKNYGEAKSFKTKEELLEYDKKRAYYSLFNLKGENVYPENFRSLHVIDTAGESIKNKERCKHIAFISYNFDNQKSIFVYDCDLQKITEWLAKDYHTIETAESDYYGEKKEFKVKKTPENSEEILQLVYDGKKFKLNNIKPNKQNQEEEYVTDREHLDALGSSNPGAFGDGDDFFVSESPSDPNSNEIQKRYISTHFKIINGKIFYLQSEHKKDTIKTEINLPYPIEKTQIENKNRSLELFTSNEKKVISQNLVLYKTNNKYGILISDTIQIKPIYDSIIFLHSYDWEDHQAYNFLVGVKDAANQKMNFGTIDIFGNTVIPMVYESIEFREFDLWGGRRGNPEPEFYNSTSQKEWKVKKDCKYGYISAKDSIILKAEYDEIKQNDSENMYFENNFKILKKGDKYGAIVGYGKNKVIVEPKFPKKPAYYINDYQGIKGKILFGLTDEGTEEENGEFFCYGDESGNVFYREGK